MNINKLLKDNMRFFRCKKGTVTIVAATMAIAIIMLFLGGTILWQGSAQSHMNDSDKDRMDELLEIQATFAWDDVAETYTAALNVGNIGPIDINLVRVWVIDRENNDHKHLDISYSIPSRSHTHINEMGVLTGLLDNPFQLSKTNYLFRVVTARGNVASTLLVPTGAFESGFSAIIIPEASWIESKGNKGFIHLEVWNNLDEDIQISLIVTTREDKGSSHTEIIQIDPPWTLFPEKITVGDFVGNQGQVYKSGEIVLLELVNIDGLVISSYYFTCL